MNPKHWCIWPMSDACKDKNVARLCNPVWTLATVSIGTSTFICCQILLELNALPGSWVVIFHWLSAVLLSLAHKHEGLMHCCDSILTPRLPGYISLMLNSLITSKATSAFLVICESEVLKHSRHVRFKHSRYTRLFVFTVKSGAQFGALVKWLLLSNTVACEYRRSLWVG